MGVFHQLSSSKRKKRKYWYSEVIGLRHPADLPLDCGLLVNCSDYWYLLSIRLAMGSGGILQNTPIFRLAVTRQLGGPRCTHPERRSLVRYARGGSGKGLERPDSICEPPNRDRWFLASLRRYDSRACRTAEADTGYRSCFNRYDVLLVRNHSAVRESWLPVLQLVKWGILRQLRDLP